MNLVWKKMSLSTNMKINFYVIYVMIEVMKKSCGNLVGPRKSKVFQNWHFWQSLQEGRTIRLWILDLLFPLSIWIWVCNANSWIVIWIRMQFFLIYKWNNKAKVTDANLIHRANAVISGNNVEKIFYKLSDNIPTKHSIRETCWEQVWEIFDTILKLCACFINGSYLVVSSVLRRQRT